MMDENKSISIITVVYNSENLIRNTIESVVNQIDKNYIQYIIIDGNSKDNTLNIINKYLNLIDIIISENDNGIYDAMNKGLELATGEWVLFLNAGDFLISNNIVKIITNSFNLYDEIVYGNIKIDYKGKKRKISPSCLFNLNFLMPFCHQAVFVKKQLFEKFNVSFDISYKVAADYNLFYFFYKHNCKFRYIDIDFTNYDLTGQSYQNPFLYQKEVFKSINTFQTNLLYKFIYSLIFIFGNLKTFFVILFQKFNR